MRTAPLLVVAMALLIAAPTRAVAQPPVNIPEDIAQAILDALDQLRDRLHTAINAPRSQNNLKQIALAIHNYESAFAKFPAAAICDKNGKPLLSWRVAILPYIEQDNLYRQFKLDEPWDSDHNKKLIAQMPKIYAVPGKKDTDPTKTHYQFFVGNGAMFDLKKGGSLSTIPDGTSNTILAAEVAEPVTWTKPDDVAYDPKVTPRLLFFYGGKSNVAMGDGSVRAIRRSVSDQTLHYLIQKADGNVIGNDF